MLVPIVNKLMAVLAILLAIGSASVLVALVFRQTRAPFMLFIKKYSVTIGALVSVGAVLGSLFYSEIAGFEPCPLCWWQRIFIYSSAVILLVAVFKKRNDAYVYVLPLSVVGISFAVNQLVLTWFPGNGFGCDAVELCTKLYINEFGFITIPLLSFLVFVSLILLSVQSRKDNVKTQ